MTEHLTDTNVGNTNYIRSEDAVRAVEFGITLASAINIETGERTELFQRENDELREAVERIKELEPADVTPVVHGKWIDHGGNKVKLNEHGETCGTCFCSRCGEWLVASDEYAVKGYFCPNCGAKMEEDNDQ